jgi:hypothetical protein
MKILIITIFAILSIGYASQAKKPNLISQNVQIQADTTEMVEFKGKYKFKENPMVQNVTVGIDKDKLVADPGDGNVYNLIKDKDKPDTFAIEEIGAMVVFVRDTNKKIIGMKVEVQGAELVADKEITDKK